ncbi:hypothetical protein [Rhodococcoides kroppenstedtii]|uniref:hypothetical protein n=1 Tax=Rhodococcoides kroppenstedtii TaxID=293050 RepID=UPI0028E9A865|nr:hypothetical protein [Rhodococcus kroppenstedtii]
MSFSFPIFLRSSAIAGTALVAVWALSNARPIDLYQAETATRSDYAFGNNWSDLFLNSSWAAGVALVVAAVVIQFGAGNRAALVIGAVVGLAVLAAPSVVSVPTGLAPTTTGVAAGLLLSFAVSAAGSERSGVTALVLGAASADPARREVDARLGSPRDWSISLGGNPATTLVPIAVLVLVGVVILATSKWLPPLPARPPLSRSAAAPIAAVVIWGVYVSFGDSASSPGQWVAAVAVTVVVVVVVALRSGADGRFLFAGLAVAATAVNDVIWSGWWLAPLALVGIAAGFVMARRLPSTVAGCCILAAVCVSGLLWDNPVSTIAYAAVLPAAAAYSFLSTPVTDRSVMTLGILLPVMIAVLGFSALGRRPSGVLMWVTGEPIELPEAGTVIAASSGAITLAALTCVTAALVSFVIGRRAALAVER